MFIWRNAIILGIIFFIVGAVYYFVQGHGATVDWAGATMLMVLGGAMAFVFTILLREPRSL
jgi:hypothetical protein